MQVFWREGDVIRRLRDLVKWRLADLAKATGVSKKSIHKIETGETREPTRKTMRALAQAFGLTDLQLQAAVPSAMELPIDEAWARETRQKSIAARAESRAASARQRSAPSRGAARSDTDALWAQAVDLGEASKVQGDRQDKGRATAGAPASRRATPGKSRKTRGPSRGARKVG